MKRAHEDHLRPADEQDPSAFSFEQARHDAMIAAAQGVHRLAVQAMQTSGASLEARSAELDATVLMLPPPANKVFQMFEVLSRLLQLSAPTPGVPLVNIYGNAAALIARLKAWTPDSVPPSSADGLAEYFEAEDGSVWPDDLTHVLFEWTDAAFTLLVKTER